MDYFRTLPWALNMYKKFILNGNELAISYL